MAQSFQETQTTAPVPPPALDETYRLDEVVTLDGDAATPQFVNISTGGSPAPAVALAEQFEPGPGEETVVTITVRAFKRTK